MDGGTIENEIILVFDNRENLLKMVTKIISRFENQPKHIFLIDGLGAALSALLLVLLIGRFDSFFGMPKPVIDNLSLLPIAFSVYSLSGYFWNPKHWQVLLKMIAVANILYCCLSLGLVIYHFEHLTIYGILYFLIEKIIVMTLAFVEWKLSNYPI